MKIYRYNRPLLTPPYSKQIHPPKTVLRASRHRVPSPVLHDADHLPLGAGVASEVRAAVLPPRGRPHRVGQADPASLRNLERGWDVRPRCQDLRRLHVLGTHRGAHAPQLLYY